MQILLFEVAHQRYALSLEDVREITPAMAITRLSGAPVAVEGVIDLRGELMPVLDLRTRFRLARKPVDPSDHLIIASRAGRAVALRVDRATDVLEMDPESLQDVPSTVPHAEHFVGVVRLADGITLICDLPSFVSATEAEALVEAMGTLT